jgi:hypothetical protein
MSVFLVLRFGPIFGQSRLAVLAPFPLVARVTLTIWPWSKVQQHSATERLIYVHSDGLLGVRDWKRENSLESPVYNTIIGLGNCVSAGFVLLEAASSDPVSTTTRPFPLPEITFNFHHVREEQEFQPLYQQPWDGKCSREFTTYNDA